MKGKQAVFYILLCLIFCGLGVGGMLLTGGKKEASTDVAAAEKKEPGGGQNADVGADSRQTSEGESDSKAGEDTKPEEADAGDADITTSAAEFEKVLVRTREENDRIVVLDAGCGGSDEGESVSLSGGNGETLLTEKEITLSIARECRKLLEEQGVYVVMSREDDRDVTDDERVYLANELPADLFISLHTESTEDSSLYGIGVVYNDAFYMEGFDNAALSRILQSETCLAANEKEAGISTMQDQAPTLRLILIPGAQVQVGYLSNMQQARLLAREDYRQKIAQGLCNGIIKALDMEKEQGNE